MLKRIMLFLAGPLLMAILFAIFAPGFLTHSEAPCKADAVVLYVGPETESRLVEARELIREGYARYLIIPSYSRIEQVLDDGSLQLVPGNLVLEVQMRQMRKAATYGRYFEATHLETWKAKRMMDDLGLHSAILVSSPYHMRRIEMIAERIFRGNDYRITFNSARFQEPFTVFDWMNGKHRKAIISEYMKMAWFLWYETFG